MTRRILTYAERRELARRREFYGRDPYTYPHWVEGWAHPYESLLSLRQKYAWINGATRREHSRLMQPYYRRDGAPTRLDDRLLAGLPAEHRAPQIPLWDIMSFSPAVCRPCLEAGYWSELPQLAGCDLCPLHGIPLERRCRRCQQSLRFGPPRFGETGAFVCGTCGAPMTSYPTRACLPWHQLPAESLMPRFAPLDALAQRVAAECNGDWTFPSHRRHDEAALLLHAFTGRRLAREWEDNGTLFGDTAVEQILPVTFVLPCDDTILAAELEDARRALLADVARHVRQSPAEDRSGRGVLGMKLHFSTHELEFKTGGALLDNVLAVLQSLDEIKRRKHDDDMVSWLASRLSSSYSRASWVGQVIPWILLAFCVWQVVRVLLWLDTLAKELLARCADDDGISEEVRQFLEQQQYDTYMQYARLEDGYFVFHLHASSWIPPYRLRTTPDGAELTVFQIIPTWEEQAGSWRRYCPKPDVGPIRPV